jgi:RNA polymerase sigma-70 factor (ECF subfamily)
MEPSDGHLVLLARAGDVGAWAALLGRHRAAMHAVAVSVLGAGADADDVVQDACLVALGGLGRLRDPDRLRSWLAGICRNLARQSIRRSTPMAPDVGHRRVDAASPEELLDAVSVQDWVWQALDELSEAHRHVVVLRYFTTANSYETIAAALEVPIGTVRSRLHDARDALRTSMAALEESVHADHARLERERLARLAGIVEEYNRGDDLGSLRAALTPDARLTATGNGKIYRGAERIVRSLEEDVEAGVQLQLLRIVASADLSVVEAAFRNPADDPYHCPPLTAQVFRHRGDDIEAIHLHYSPA